MVSADNLNQDVLGVIMTFLPQTGLASIALVSKSFYGAVIPKLYRSITFRTAHACRYPKVKTALGVVLLHPWFATYVRNVDIRTVPILDSKPHPKFLLECSQALLKCDNLTSFKCAVVGLPTIVKWIKDKPRLKELQLKASSLTAQQVEVLMQSGATTGVGAGGRGGGGLETLSLEYASCNTMDMLPRWAERLGGSLTSLTLCMTPDLNKTVLEGALKQLPGLTALQVVGCQRIDHLTLLRLVFFTPQLQSLAFTVMETNCTMNISPPVPNLQHLAIDTQNCAFPNALTEETLLAILPGLQLAQPEYTSVVARFTASQSRLAEEFVKKLSKKHKHCLKRLAILHVALSVATIRSICKTFKALERLEVAFPLKDIPSFTDAIKHSRTLQTLIDTDTHTIHGTRQSLNNESVRGVMKAVPSLKKVVTGQRIWMARREADRQPDVSFERVSAHGPTRYWFARRE